MCVCPATHILGRIPAAIFDDDCFSEAADKVVKGEGKFEELMVCSQEIAASTTQLVIASKVE